jgi:hypothetical protein
MTTIAIDSKGFIAADGFVIWGGEIRNRAQRKLKVSNGAIYGFTGLTALMDVMIEWHQKHEANPEKLSVCRTRSSPVATTSCSALVPRTPT